MTLNQLTYFSALAACENYTQAARQLYISQPSLSYAMANLEKELGCTLFCRQGRGVSLTEAGRTFQHYADTALAAIRQGVQAVSTGTLRVGAISTAMGDHLPGLIVGFTQENPQITLEVTAGASRDILAGIEASTLDVGICSYAPEFTNVRFEPLYTEPWVLVTPEDHPLLRLGRPVTLAEVAQYPLLCYKRISPIHTALLDAFAAAGITPCIAYELDDETAIGGMVQRGMGISLCLNNSLLRPFALPCVPLAEPMPERVVYCAFRADGDLSPGLRRFLHHLRGMRSVGEAEKAR